MNFYIINGSPRKKCNTSQLLNKVIGGIEDNSAKKHNINLINLYELNYKGCKSCFHCKKISGKYYGQCPIKDDLRPLLPKIWECDGLVIGSPIYFGNLTGETNSFIERLLFPKLVYGGDPLIKKGIPTVAIYTMNATEEVSDIIYNRLYETFENALKNVLKGEVYSHKVYDTYQFKDYNKYENYYFKEEDKAKVRKTQFPKDLEKAYRLGAKLVEKK